MAEQDLDSGKGFLRKLSSWFLGTSLPNPTSSPSEASTAPTVKNKAVMAFEEHPKGTIFCAPEGQELITKEIRLPVNPAEDTAWSKSVSRDFASVLSIQTQYSQTLERALYLIAQAVEHDRFEQRSKGQIGFRDPALRQFKPGGGIEVVHVTSDMGPAIFFFDPGSKAAVLGTGFLKDYFKTVSALLFVAEQAALPVDGSIDSPTPTLRSAQRSYENSADRLEMVKRYVGSLESGSPEDKHTWAVALEREIAHSLFDAGRHRCAIQISEILDAVLKSHPVTVESPQLSEDVLQRQRDFCRALVGVVNALNLRVEGVLELDDDGNVPLDPHNATSPTPSSIDIRSPEGRSALLELVKSNRDAWFHINGNADALLTTLTEDLENMAIVSSRALEAQMRYDELFSVAESDKSS